MPLEILSFGGGVQSTAVLLMSIHGELPPLDHVIFADTGWEPPKVYEHVERCEQWCKDADLPFHRVSAGNIREDSVAYATGGKRAASLPYFLSDGIGDRGIIRRQCTQEYKIQPLRRKAREIMERVGEKRITLWFGISLDEMRRMRTSDVKYVTHWYPLIEQRMSRLSCLAWIERNGYPKPARSACIGCPFRSDREWREMKNENPADFADAVDFDQTVRNIEKIDKQVFLHRSCKPLSEVEFEDTSGQLRLWDDECTGMCGV